MQYAALSAIFPVRESIPCGAFADYRSTCGLSVSQLVCAVLDDNGLGSLVGLTVL